MSRRIFDTPFSALVPESIRSDATINAAAQALQPALRGLVHGVPDLLLFSRLGAVHSLGVADASGSELIATRCVRQIHSAEHLSAAGAGKVPTPGQLSPVMQRLADAAGGLRPLSEVELELLAWQLHVDFREVAKTREQLAEMVRWSIPWHRIKGTPASIRAALRLFGWSAVIEEGEQGRHWATYQLDLPNLTDHDTVRRIYTVAHEMQPARCRLWRVYNSEFDWRPIRPTRGPALSDGWLSFYSGVPVTMPDGEDVLVSFGSALRFEADPFAEAGAGVGVGHAASMIFYAPYIDKFIVGISRLGDKFPHNHGFAIGGLYSGFLGEPEMGGRKWVGRWDGKPWIDTMPQAGFDRRLPPWRMEYRSSSYSQLVLGEGQRLGDENARIGPSTFTTIDNPGRVGEMRLGVHNPDRRVQRIHKFFIEFSGAELPELNPGPDAFSGLSAATGTDSDNLHAHPTGWTGRWAKRRWWPYVAYAKIGEQGLYDELHEVLHTDAPGVTRIPDNIFTA